MGDVKLSVAGRIYDVSCADGDEAHLESLAAIVDEKTSQARMVVGDVNEARQLLFAAIFLADDLQNAKAAALPTEPAADLSPQIMAIVERINRLSEKIGTSG